MRRATRNGVIAVAAASGAMALTSPVHADSVAGGAAAGSPGLLSGNTVQLPVHLPVNVCGNTVNVVGLLNAAADNGCVDEGGQGAPGGSASSEAQGTGSDSPGVLSGNTVQLPVRLPVNVTGNSVSVVGVGDVATGNESANTSGDHPRRPAEPAPKPTSPPRAHPVPERGVRHAAAFLAHTGADDTLPAAAASAALVLGGAVLYRRFRPRAPR